MAEGPNISIINGQPASECEWTWQVSHQDDYGHICGGMLLTPQWVLSAAHCGPRVGEWIRAGSLRTGTGGQKIQIADVKMHPSYNSGSNDFDLVLLRLKSPMQMNGCVGTVCLPQQDVAPGTKCWITGWGSTRQNDLRSPTRSWPSTLQEVEVTALSNTQCSSNQYNYTRGQILPSMICAQGRNSQGVTDACQGDSGGPLVCQVGGVWNIYGATSWGYGCGQDIHPGVWARVHSARSWIEGYVGGSSPSPPPSPPRRRATGPSPSPSGYIVGSTASNACPSGSYKLTEPECSAAAGVLGYTYQGTYSEPTMPSKCYLTHRLKIRFNTHSGTDPIGKRYPVCKTR